jgi:iron-sulfur cluster repair protein YtfE (RIC family)
MKRHPALIPLSREHHGALILARLLQKDAPVYKGLPTDTQGKAEYAYKFYQEELVKHFEDEERVLKLVTGVESNLDLMIKTIYREHQELHKLFQSIDNHPDLTSHLDQIGKTLETHIRKEERELFPLMQETCNEDLMIKVDKSLSSQ